MCSSNGTYVNGELVGKDNVKLLKFGDVVTICDAESAASMRLQTNSYLAGLFILEPECTQTDIVDGKIWQVRLPTIRLLF